MMEKNPYIISIGAQLSSIREIMGWTQEDLSRRIGLSRAVVINIEQDPRRMNKTAAMALYTAVFGEMSRKRKEYDQLDYHLWQDCETRPLFLQQLNQISWGRKNIASVLATFLLRNTREINNTALINFLSSLDLVAEGNSIRNEEIKQALHDFLNRVEGDLLLCFGLETPDISLFLNQLEGVIRYVQGVQMELLIGDISDQPGIDAIVNATDNELSGGGSGDRAVHHRAGPELDEECRLLAPIETGTAVITGAYKLPNRFIIHCAGPIYGQNEHADKLLASCYHKALDLAEDEGISSLAFPSISTGTFGYPIAEAAQVALETIWESIAILPSLKMIRFVLFDNKTLTTYLKVLDQISSSIRS